MNLFNQTMFLLLGRLERGVYNLMRGREGAIKKYKGFQIPWEWMLDTGFVSQVLDKMPHPTF